MSGGGTVYEYQRELTARLERTERALSDARHQCEVLRRERDEARAEVERLREALRTVGERQREACAAALEGHDGQYGLSGSVARKMVRATPLVTED